jgi:hypothetical protein
MHKQSPTFEKFILRPLKYNTTQTSTKQPNKTNYSVKKWVKL